MEKTDDELINKFNVKYDTHPELYISLHQKDSNGGNYEQVLELMETNDEIPFETIVLLFSLNRTNINV
tara:strand:- start:10973 stop:11176 length:204 start_codon:yes stop_codon:yes gene_type:complete